MTETLTMEKAAQEELLEAFEHAAYRGKEGVKRFLISLIKKYGENPEELDMLYKMLYPKISLYGLSFQFGDYRTKNIVEGQAWEALIITVKYVELDENPEDADPDCETYATTLQHILSKGILHHPERIKAATRCLEAIIETGITPESYDLVMELCETIKKEAEQF